MLLSDRVVKKHYITKTFPQENAMSVERCFLWECFRQGLTGRNLLFPDSPIGICLVCAEIAGNGELEGVLQQKGMLLVKSEAKRS